MLTDRNIAFFLDVDGLRLKTEHYEEALNQLENMGTILYGKIYGCGERKHKAICHDADMKGYRLERVKRVKRRGRREFDNRIFVDVVDVVCSTPAIDTVCIVSQPCDMVYLYSYLRGRGIKIIALDNVDDPSHAFIDEIMDLGLIYEIKLPREKKPHEERPRTSEHSENVDELLREIEYLRAALQEKERQTAAAVYNEPAAAEAAVVREEEEETVREEESPLYETPAEETAEEPAEETIPQPEQTAEEPVEETVADDSEQIEEEPLEETAEEEQPAEEEPQTEPDDGYREAKELLDMAVAEKEEESMAETPDGKRVPRASYAPQNDSDLIRKIEEIRKGSADQTPENLLDRSEGVV